VGQRQLSPTLLAPVVLSLKLALFLALSHSLMRVVLSVAAVLAYTTAALCASVSLATATQAAASIDDVQSIVIFMQENRAFDHYYGTLDGVCCCILCLAHNM
jgi:phospholipase C